MSDETFADGCPDEESFERNIKGNELRKVDGKYESLYMVDSEFVFQKLNEVSPSFCLAKWFNVSIHIPTGQTHSCYHPRAHHIPLEEISANPAALHNTNYKKQQRQMMLDGVRPPECEFCWQIEDSGTQLSDRAYRSKDIYAAGLIEEAIALGANGDAMPRYLEVNFNQSCNFRCTYCSPHLSSAWFKDIELNGPYILEDRWHNDLSWMQTKNLMPDNGPDNPYLAAFWGWFPVTYDSLQTLRMTGGEPLMDKNTFRIFDFVKAHPKDDLHLSITSNCCPPGDLWEKFMESMNEMARANAFDHFMLFCSLDSWGEQAAYIRDGMDFDLLYRNVTDYLKNGYRHSLTFIITFNALSYTGWNEYIRQIHELRKEYNTDRQLIWFDVPMLTTPEWLDPRLLPEMVSELEQSIEFMLEHKETRHTQFKGFSDFEVSKVQRLIDWIKAESPYDRELATRNFRLYIKEHDRRRGTDFVSVFPELKNFYLGENNEQ